MRSLWAAWLVLAAASWALGGGCAAGSAADVGAGVGCDAHTAACEPDGYFSTADGHCATHCVQEGACVEDDATGCHPGTVQDCEHSSACLMNGACSLGAFAGAPMCRPADDAHCLASSQCKGDGSCHFATSYLLDGVVTQLGPQCVPTSDADCQQSDLCAQLGHCRVRGWECVCPDFSQYSCK